jgi:hypothetical protein
VAINHVYDNCWLNPSSKYFKPSMYKARLNYMEEQKIPIPKLMQKGNQENIEPKKNTE